MIRTPAFWQHRTFLSRLLWPLSLLYGTGAALDRRFTFPKQAPAPVIGIGNVTVGGAGKTPVTLALVPLLRQLGYTPHILSRGYGGMGARMHRVEGSDDWRLVGDEPLLLSAVAPTWVDAQRYDAAKTAVTAGATLLLADDALQHHALHKNITLLVIDAGYGIGNGYLLPAGPLRESFTTALAASDAVILIGEGSEALAASISKPIFRAALVPVTQHQSWSGMRCFAFAGIGRPQKFYATLRTLGAQIIATQDFPDHHPYTDQEIRALFARATAENATLVTTAKDAVKIPADLRPRIQVLEVKLQWQNEAPLRAWLQERLTPPPASRSPASGSTPVAGS